MIHQDVERSGCFRERQGKGANVHERIDDAVPTPFFLDHRHLVEEIFRGDGGLGARLAGRCDGHPRLRVGPA